MEAVEDATTGAYLEAYWLAERISGGEGLFISWGRCGLTISYAHPGRGGGILCWWRRHRQKRNLAQIVRK